MDRFLAARLKIERANKHIADLEKLLSSLPNVYTPTIEINEEARMQVISYFPPKIDEISSLAALIIGDAIHNLRVGMEYAYLGAVERHVPGSFDADHTKIPFKATREDVERVLRERKIDIACPELFKRVVSEIQPYKGSGNVLFEALHDLDVRDKHVLLVPIAQIAWLRDVIVEDEKGHRLSAYSYAITGTGPYTLPIPLNYKIQDKGELAATIAFDYVNPLKGAAVVDGLKDFSGRMRYLIGRLETI